jgi:hypothetical protein
MFFVWKSGIRGGVTLIKPVARTVRGFGRVCIGSGSSGKEESIVLSVHLAIPCSEGRCDRLTL